MDDCVILAHEAEVAQKAFEKSWQALEALQEQCRHPQASIVNESNRTCCSDCEKQFWPSSTFWSKMTGLNTVQQSISSLREKYTAMRATNEARLKRLQSDCSHPVKKESQHPDYADTCLVCGLDWDKVPKLA